MMPPKPPRSTSQPKVCYFCGNLSRENLGEWRPPRTLAQVEQDAEKSGCQACLMLCWVVSDFVSGTQKPGTVIRSMRVDTKFWLAQTPASPITLLLDLRALVYGAEVRNQASLRIFGTLRNFKANLYPWDSICQWELLPECSSNGSTGSVGYLNKIRSWMETCDKNHPECFDSSSREHPNLPTRVLDVRPTLTGEDPRLHISNGEKAPFMCLSYCWGGSLPIRTTRETIKTFCEGIIWSHLPRTFQDAVSVARYLGISFIWIDSLCIVQDDEQDWEYEAAQMANIYGRSTLTIAATTSSGPNASLFHILSPECPDRPVSPAVLPLETPPLHYRSAISHGELQNCMDDHFTTDQYRAFPLLRRAWAFQEHLLSPRIVHFTTRELVWECSQTLSCCCSPVNAVGTGLQKQVSSLLGKNTCKLPVTSEQDLFTLWYKIVSCYMTKRLTRESDRLPALSGIAKKAQRKLNSKYLAGLWETDLAKGLGWTVCTALVPPGVPASRRSSKYRAPTWSWVSVEGQVEWNGLSEAAGIKLLRSHCENGDLDSTGGVHGGYLHLSGLVVLAYYRYDNPWLSDSPYKLCRDHSSDLDPRASASFNADTRIDIEGPEKINDGATVYCLALHGMPKSKGTFCFNTSPFMVLRSTTSTEHDDIPVYSRAGLGWSTMDNHFSWVNLFKSATEKEIIII